MIILVAIFIFLLFGNWLINDALIFIPVQFFSSLTSSGWWILAFFVALFLAWCVGEE